MINEVFGLVSKASTCTTDGVDQLNYYITALIVIILSSFATMRTYVGDPIDCWSPTYFSGQWVHYTDTYCWVKNTYYLPFEITIETGREEEFNKKYEMKYYQWVPIILACQALMFFLPSLLWEIIIGKSLELEHIVEASRERHIAINPQERNITMTNLAEHFTRYLKNQRNYKPQDSCLRLLSPYQIRRKGKTIGPLYLMLKTIYLLNAGCQLFALDSFVGNDFHWYGLLVIKDMWSGRDWAERSSFRFPTITLCDFTVRTLGNLQRFTVQCVLSINLFNEKTFIFVWFWILFVMIVTLVNLIIWIYRVMCKSSQTSYIEKHLHLTGLYMQYKENHPNYDKAAAIKVTKFIEYIKPDGVFILRIVAKNTSSMIATELVRAIWLHFSMNYEQNDHEISQISKKDGTLNKSDMGVMELVPLIKDNSVNKNDLQLIADLTYPPSYKNESQLNNSASFQCNKNSKITKQKVKKNQSFFNYFNNPHYKLSTFTKSKDECDLADVSEIVDGNDSLGKDDDFNVNEKSRKKSLQRLNNLFNEESNIKERLEMTFGKDASTIQNVSCGDRTTLNKSGAETQNYSLLPQTTYGRQSSWQPAITPVPKTKANSSGIANLSTVMCARGAIMGRKVSTDSKTYARTPKDFKKGATPVAVRKDMSGRKTIGGANLPSLTV